MSAVPEAFRMFAVGFLHFLSATLAINPLGYFMHVKVCAFPTAFFQGCSRKWNFV